MMDCDFKEYTLDQEIEFIKEDIENDEALRGCLEFTSFHENRIAENTVKLQEFLDIKEAKTQSAKP